MKKSFFLFFLACIVFIGSSCNKNSKEIIGTDKKMDVSSLERPTEIKEKAKSVNFNPKVTILPADFSPHDPFRVIQGIEQLQTAKGEFEKSDIYEKRIASLNESFLYDDVSVGGYLVFSVSKLVRKINYDADNETISYSEPSFFGMHEINQRPIAQSNEDIVTGFLSPKSLFESYLNTKHRTLKFKEVVYLVRDNAKIDSAEEIIATAKLSPEKAKELKDKISILMVGKVVKPFLSTKVELPSEDNQTETIYTRKISFKLEAVWLVNNLTGEILSRTFQVKKYNPQETLRRLKATNK